MIEFENFEITKRELMFSIIIVLIMVFAGLFINNLIENHVSETNEKYYAATQIDANADQFSYGMNTSIGNTLVYGKVTAVDSAALPELSNKYLAIEKTKERYTMHTKTVSHKSGKTTYYTVETYYTWDTVRTDYSKAKTISFLNANFDASKIDLPDYRSIPLNNNTVSKNYISWIHYGYLYENGNTLGDVRYCYSGVPLSFSGTIFANLKSSSIFNVDNNNSRVAFFLDQKPKDIIQNKQNSEGTPTIVFWVLWSLLIAIILFGFFYASNNWLEDNENFFKNYNK